MPIEIRNKNEFKCAEKIRRLHVMPRFSFESRARFSLFGNNFRVPMPFAFSYSKMSSLWFAYVVFSSHGMVDKRTLGTPTPACVYVNKHAIVFTPIAIGSRTDL